MWSCRLNKVKSSRFKRSITNSGSLAAAQQDESGRKNQQNFYQSYFFSKMGNWQYLIELFIASNVLALLIALAEAQSWGNLQAGHVIQYILYINWILLAFVALIDVFQKKIQKFNAIESSIFGFFLLQGIVFFTTIVLNLVGYWGAHHSLQNFLWANLTDNLVLHLSYGVLLGAFCLRYIYMREQWLLQQNSELNARIQAMQARIHPHFLFNSLNSVVSLISIDPDKAEQMLIDLSRLFRASFQELKLVSLNEEIELCRHYIAIEQIRLGDRLQVEWNIQQPLQLLQVKIPLLTLQPLIENSIFHGVEKKIIDAKIGILVEILQNQVTIVITNPFIQDKIKAREGHGIAIENVKQRLKAHFGNGVQFRNYASKELFTTVIQYQNK
ncbi:sensor histidine kinase [Acinetobacter silvestris]|uniref:Alginate biosynthesis protein n=1 Tax=Acinetobacter silvestris TaxID=1977882 RepID=A0A1Y3CJ87_9GAMM|nr:histidine kinase [Acinetobacter silvestris]OTG67221.1 alginate biosynthesis protein [Acinetobacter silvestris]